VTGRRRHCLSPLCCDRKEKAPIDVDPQAAKGNCRAILASGALPGGVCFAGCDTKLAEKITLRSPHPHLYCDKRPNLGKLLLAVQTLRVERGAKQEAQKKKLHKARDKYKRWAKVTTTRRQIQCTQCKKWRVTGAHTTFEGFTCSQEHHTVSWAKAQQPRQMPCEISCTRCARGGRRCRCAAEDDGAEESQPGDRDGASSDSDQKGEEGSAGDSGEVPGEEPEEESEEESKEDSNEESEEEESDDSDRTESDSEPLDDESDEDDER
jgi:hypothetical protein